MASAVMVCVMGAVAPVWAETVSREAVTVRLQSLEDPRDDLREAAQRSLVLLGPGAIEHLGPMLLETQRSWEQRASIAWVLGEIGDPQGRRPLEQAWGLKEAPGTFRIQVALALGSLGEHKALRSFIHKDGDRVLLAKAAISLGNLGDKESIPLLTPFKDDPDVGSFVVLALGRLGDDSVKTALRSLLKEAMFRDYAAVALATLGDRTVLFQLRFALENPDVFVRRDAALQLGRLEDDEALSKLETMGRKDPDPRVRKAATTAVRRIQRAQRRNRR